MAFSKLALLRNALFKYYWYYSSSIWLFLSKSQNSVRHVEQLLVGYSKSSRFRRCRRFRRVDFEIDFHSISGLWYGTYSAVEDVAVNSDLKNHSEMEVKDDFPFYFTTKTLLANSKHQGFELVHFAKGSSLNLNNF